MQVKYHHVIGQGDGVVVGCEVCGTVEHLMDNEIHKCQAVLTPFAVTIDTTELPGLPSTTPD